MCFIVDGDVIDVGHTGLHFAGKTQTATQVLCVHSRRKAELGVVREFERVGLIVGPDDADNRPEDFLTEQLHLRGHISEYMRSDQTPLNRPSQNLTRAFFASLFDLGSHRFQLTVVDHRANDGVVIHLVAISDGCGALSVSINEVVIERGLDNDAVD